VVHLQPAPLSGKTSKKGL